MKPFERLAAHRAVALALALLVPGPTLLPAQAQVRLPSLGESASEDFSVGTEFKLGEQIMREIRRDPDYLDDPVLLEYLQSIWVPLVAAARAAGNVEPDIDRQFAFESFLVRDRNVNAFALPGGFVGVNLGLIAITASTDELASVLAHELSHVTQRHIARSLVASQRSSMVGLATLILGILAAARANSTDLANAAILGSQATAVQGQLNFSRDMEREADRLGFAVLGGAGFSPSAMAGMFEKLDTASRLNDNGAFPYLRSHPLTVDRMAEARSRALFAGPETTKTPLRHALMQARARVLMDTDPAQLRRYEDQAGGLPGAAPRDRLVSLYTGALSATLQRHGAQAEKLAAQALEAVQAAQQAGAREPQAERAVRLLQVQLRLANGDPAGALQALDAAGGDGRQRATVLYRGQALLDLQRRQGTPLPALRESTETLQIWVAEHPLDAEAWDLLSASAGAVGLKLRALRAGAEARAAVGDLTGAIDRLRAAQQASKGAAGQDFIEASVIDARLRSLRAQQRQLALDARGGQRSSRDGDDAPPQ